MRELKAKKEPVTEEVKRLQQLKAELEALVEKYRAQTTVAPE